MPQLCPGQRPPFLSVTSRVRIPAAPDYFSFFPGQRRVTTKGVQITSAIWQTLFVPLLRVKQSCPLFTMLPRSARPLDFYFLFFLLHSPSVGVSARQSRVFSSFINDDTCTALLLKRSNCRAGRFASRCVSFLFFASKGKGVRITSAIWPTLFVPLLLYPIGV